jgi:malate synthase
VCSCGNGFTTKHAWYVFIIRQGIRSASNLTLQDTGHPITAAYIEGVLRQAARSVKSLVPSVQDKNIQIALEYMISQVKADRASDFLTSDLMPYLEQLDGGKWIKASL